MSFQRAVRHISTTLISKVVMFTLCLFAFGQLQASYPLSKRSVQRAPLKEKIKTRLQNNFIEIKVKKKITLKQTPDKNGAGTKEITKYSDLVILELSDKTEKSGSCNGYWLKVAVRLYGDKGWILSCDIDKASEYVNTVKDQEVFTIFHKVPLHHAPTGLSKSISTLKKNTKLKLLAVAKKSDRSDIDRPELNGDGIWKFVETADGKQGWVFDIAAVTEKEVSIITAALKKLNEGDFLKSKGLRKKDKLYLSSLRYDKKEKRYKVVFLVYPEPLCMDADNPPPKKSKIKCRNYTAYSASLECSNFEVYIDSKGDITIEKCYY